MSAATDGRIGLDETKLIPDPPPEAVPYDPVDSWNPIALATLEPRPVEPPRLAHGLLYPGRRHLWSGEPESGKSWAALIACAQEVLRGRTVLYIDFETDEHETAERFAALGLPPEALVPFLYVRPAEPVGRAGVREHLDRMVSEHRPTIVVVDAYAGALDLHGLDPNKGADIERLNRALFEPLRAHGAAVVVLDHLAKDRERRGKFSIGSERKVGAVDVHLGFEVVDPFGRGRTGLVAVSVHKDRPGYLLRPHVADLHLESDPGTGRITYEFRRPPPADETGSFRPTRLMEKVSRHVESQREPISRNVIENDVSGQRRYVRAAIDTLAREGYLTETAGPRNARRYQSVRAYREAQDPVENGLEDDLARPRPDLARGEDE